MAILEAPEPEGEAGAQPLSAPCSHAALGQGPGRQGFLPDQPARMNLSAGVASGDSSSDGDEVTPRRCTGLRVLWWRVQGCRPAPCLQRSPEVHGTF